MWSGICTAHDKCWLVVAKQSSACSLLLCSCLIWIVGCYYCYYSTAVLLRRRSRCCCCIVQFTCCLFSLLLDAACIVATALIGGLLGATGCKPIGIYCCIVLGQSLLLAKWSVYKQVCRWLLLWLLVSSSCCIVKVCRVTWLLELIGCWLMMLLRRSGLCSTARCCPLKQSCVI